MSKAAIHGVLIQVRQIQASHQTDAELLERFIARGDESAFAEVVQRHGPKVYAVCRRVLGQHHLAEDAYQATFLVLAKKAPGIQPRSAVGGFLYGVARKAALEARALSRRRKELFVSQLPDRPSAPVVSADADVLAMLDEEVANLSEKYRAAVVLCELDGVSRAEAARQLDIAEGTLSSRLAAARKQLAMKLQARGVTFSAALFTALVGSANATAPPALATASAAVSAIAAGVLRAMLLAKWKIVTTLCALVAAFAAWSLLPAPLPNADAAPAPLPKRKDAMDEGLIWLHEHKANRLVAYSPSGEVAQRLNLPDTQTFLGLTPDGRQIVYSAKSRDKFTYHLRDLGPDTPGTDLGLDCSPHDLAPLWNREGTKFIRQRGEDPKQFVGVRSSVLTYDVFDLRTKTTTRIEHPFEHWVLGWAPDQTQFVTMDVGNGEQSGALFLTAGEGELTPLKRVGDQVLAHHAVAAPDGRTLLIGGVLRTPPKQPWHHALWTLDVPTGRVTQLIHEDGHGYTQAFWSPDGSRLCMMWGYTKDPTSSDGWDEQRLTFAKADGTDRKTLTLRDKSKGESTTGLALLGWFPAKAAKQQIGAPEPKQAPRQRIGRKPDPEAEALVRQLGSEDFQERQAAEKKLREMGPKALLAVKAGLQSSELEIVRRCKNLLPELVQADLMRADHPAWERFAGIVGDGKPGRALYVEMISDPRRALRILEVEDDLDKAHELYDAELKLRVDAISEGQRQAERRNALRTGMNLPDSGIMTRGEYLTLLFLGCYPGTGAVTYRERSEHDRVCHFNLFSLSTPKALREKNDPNSPALRRLYAAWLNRRAHEKPLEIGLHQSLSIAIPECLSVARRLAAEVRLAAIPLNEGRSLI
jgi:RNA polymerase sigma factor (sigma-70 family)